MLKVMRIFLVVSLVFAAFVVAGIAQKKYAGKTMVVYLGVTEERESIIKFIGDKLEEKWGIKLIVEEMGSNDMLQKVVLMRDKPTVTICEWDEPVGIQAAAMGLTAPIDLDNAPNLYDLSDYAIYRKNGEVHVLSRNPKAVGLLYNEEIFEREGLEPPTGWADLWREDLSGRVSITALESTWGTAALVSIARWKGGGEENIDPGFEAYKTLLPHIHTIHTWSSEFIKLLQLNEVWMGTTGSSVEPALRAQDFPARWVAPKEGSPMVNGGISIVANAPYQDVAHDYLNLYFDLEFQIYETLNLGEIPVNERVWRVLSENELKRLPLTPEKFDSLQRLDFDIIAEHRQDWIERFHKEIFQD